MICRKESKRSKFIWIILFLIILPMVFLITVETILAQKGQISFSGIKRYIRLRENNPSAYRNYVPNQESLELTDNLKIKPYTIQIDAEGYVYPSKIHDNPDVKLVFLGGSTTACFWMAEDNRFPYVTGRLLEKSTDLKINSYNSGVGGNDSLHSLNILVNKIMPLKPDFAVMMHNINDLTVLLFESSYWSTNPSRSPIVEFKSDLKLKELIPDLVPNIYAETKRFEKTVRQWRYKLLGRKTPDYQEKASDEFQHVRGKKIIIDSATLLKNFEFNLQTFINICLAGKITPVLMTQPNRLKDPADPFIKQTLASIEKQHGITHQDYKRIYDLLNERTRLVAARNQILLIDLAKDIPPEKEFMYDIVHLTDEGSIAAANLIAAQLSPLVSRVSQEPRRVQGAY